MIFLIQIFVLSLGLSVSLSSMGQVDAKCPTKTKEPIDIAAMTPLGIEKFLEANAAELKDVADIICCLPEPYKDKFVIMHSSIAAQNSDVFGPRAILFQTLPGDQGKPKLQCAISFNGGDHHLNNSQNLEVMCNNEETKEVEFYDIARKGDRFRLSEKNPATCMLCHGSGGKLGPGGPRTIFEEFDNWTRAVQGVHACREELPLSRAIEKTAEKVFETNPRYKCLNQVAAKTRHFSGKFSSTAPELGLFDKLMAGMNSRRTARLVKSTEDFERMKYAIMGSMLCFDGHACRGSEEKCFTDFQEWIPESRLKEMKDTSRLSKPIRTSSDLQSTVRLALQKDAESIPQIARSQQMAVKALEKGVYSKSLAQMANDFWSARFDTDCLKVHQQRI